MLAAFAGLQDWDGLFQFDYGRAPKVTPLDGAGLPLANVAPQQGKQLTLQAPTLWYLVEAE
ncbi:MAG: hypothetical protein KKI08_03635 [Armatimonadetes bacterium]|nr:hypothetical protein [Armatimonadota bacterium]